MVFSMKIKYIIVRLNLYCIIPRDRYKKQYNTDGKMDMKRN